MRMNDDYYRALAADLTNLLERASDQLLPHRVSEVSEFIEFSEYGVALTWLADSLVETGKPIEAEITETVVSLARRMGSVQDLPAAFQNSN